jgi:hypothetical protein
MRTLTLALLALVPALSAAGDQPAAYEPPFRTLDPGWPTYIEYATGVVTRDRPVESQDGVLLICYYARAVWCRLVPLGAENADQRQK